MYKDLERIYQKKIINNPQFFDSNRYYYFYNDNNIFAIEKTITKNEYLLIKAVYIEKTFHFDNTQSQKIYEYLFEGKQYPFNERARFLLYKNNDNNENINSLLKDILGDIYVFEYKNYTIVFYFKHFNEDIESIFQTMSNDFSITLYVHNGVFTENSINGSNVVKYIESYLKTIHAVNLCYSDVSDVIFEIEDESREILLKYISESILNRIYENVQLSEVVNAFLKNDLNVSKTSKVLYMHRNSLLMKLETIAKLTGLNIQNFKHACTILILIAYKK